MTGTLTVLVAVLLGGVAALGAAAVVLRLVRTARTNRRAALAAGPRRQLLSFVASGGTDSGDDLVALPPSAWRAIEPSATALLGKIRGEARDALVTVFERRGAAGAAVREARARSPVRRARAAEALGNLARHDAAPALCAMLSDPHPDVRVVAARALGRVAAPGSAEPLLSALAAATPIPPQPVAHSLIQIGRDAAPAVVAALRHPVPLVRVTALDVLGALGVTGTAVAVAEVLATDPEQEVRVAAAAALGRLGTRPAVRPLLAATGADQPAAVRAAAARALGELGAVVASPSLAGLLGDAQHRVAYEAAHALRRLGPPGLAELRLATNGTAAPAAPVAEPGGRNEPDGAAAGADGPVGAAVADGVRPGVVAAYAREALALVELAPAGASMRARTTASLPPGAA